MPIDISQLFGTRQAVAQEAPVAEEAPRRGIARLGDPNIMAAIMLADLMSTGGKNIPDLKTIFGLLVGTRPTGQAQTLLINVKTAGAIVDELETLFAKAGGGMGSLRGIPKQFLSRFPEFGAEAKAFRDIRSGYLARLVRALGEVGTLNEGDIKRAISLVPTFTDSPASARIKFNSIRDMIGATEQAARSGGTSAIFNPFEDLTSLGAGLGF